MAATTTAFADVRPEFERYIGDIVYATMITVDAKSRPRARLLIPVWEIIEGSPTGWLATYRTPVKTAHLARNPHTTFSYWSPRQNAVHIDASAAWQDDPETRRHVWDLYRKGSPPGAGYNPANFWRKGPQDPEFAVLRLTPWRIQTVRGADLRSLIWQAPDP
ncbi:pyridoxamine 5'-phosphate oxidase family protein [Actinomadura gamaensis]|uniref:Pyridoxamine 5'-phosphate oxidase family protein n=1 Tax=Actinomadura gamaensis TaxID=1763541 RepID=A0ABV9UB34_9ACTN